MTIWASEIKELERLYETFKGKLPDLEKELERLIKADDENMILLYSRRCLEVIITDLCECELKRPRKTEPLKGIIDKLHKEEKAPSNIITSMDHLNSLSAYGAHPKDFDPEQVKPVLINLDIIIKWYLKYTQIITIQTTEEKEDKVQIRDRPSREKIEIGLKKEVQEKPVRSNKNRFLSGLLITAIMVIAGILAYPKIFKRSSLDKLRSSGEKIAVAVMPFQNMTNDTIWNVWQDGIQNELINNLTNSEELKIKQADPTNSMIQGRGLTSYASITPSVASNISQRLNAELFLIGTIKKAGNTIRLNTQLIDSKTKEVLKSFQVQDTYKEEKIFQLVDSLSGVILDFLVISRLRQEQSRDAHMIMSTKSPDAYRYFVHGLNAFKKLDYPNARNFFSQALAIDSNFTGSITYISSSYWNQGSYDQSKKWCLKAYEKIDQMPVIQKLYTNWLYATNFETPRDEIIYLKEILEIDDQLYMPYFLLGNSYLELNQYDKAILAYEKALETFKRLGINPSWIYNYSDLGRAYHNLGKYKKEKKLYKKAEKDFPDDYILLSNQAVLSLAEGNESAAKRYIDKYISVRQENSVPEAIILNGLASIYFDADIPDKAQECYRQALLLEPENPSRLNNLAWCLIDKDVNLDEGLRLINKAIELNPNDYTILDTKGWGLYKQGKYQEAIEILQKSWNLKPIYDHELYLHLEAAKKAVANQKNI